MYAGMKVNHYEITKTTTVRQDESQLPVFLGCFSSDKGTEEMTLMNADNFKAMYGKTADFFRYGQPLLQAHNIVNSGGLFLGCRIVAEDATLGNAIITAKISGESGGTAATIEYNIQTVEGAKSFAEVVAAANDLILAYKNAASGVEPGGDPDDPSADPDNPSTDPDTPTTPDDPTVDPDEPTPTPTPDDTTTDLSQYPIPLMVITDNGRGVSNKKFKIVPNYLLSRSLPFCVYYLYDIENGATAETTPFSVNPDAKMAFDRGTTQALNLIEKSTVQFRTMSFDDGIKLFIERLADVSGLTTTYLYANDPLFGYTSAGKKMDEITVDISNDAATDETTRMTKISLNNNYGIGLTSGSNGSFGDAPFPGANTPIEAWTNGAVKFFGGGVTTSIFDLDVYKIDFCCDANYPDAVKREIETLAKWRKDFFYFRDLGLNINSYTDVVNKVTEQDSDGGYVWTETPFAGDYCSVYDIIDPYSKKQIPVTCVYSIAPKLVPYYANSLACPLAGQFNGFTIDGAVEGTLRFAPKIYPKTSIFNKGVDEKTLMDQLQVNFVNYTNPGVLEVESLYTSWKSLGPLSYANNLIVTQVAVKAIRTYMPRIRFQLIEGNDFTNIKHLVDDNVLNRFSKYFQSIQMIYTADPAEVQAHIFHASIECYYKMWEQSEIFDVYAIDGTPNDSAADYESNVITIE